MFIDDNNQTQKETNKQSNLNLTPKSIRKPEKKTKENLKYQTDENQILIQLVNSDLNKISDSYDLSRNNHIAYLAKEFFLDCKQRLDSSTFKNLLNLLNSHKLNNTNDNFEWTAENFELLQKVFDLIKEDKALSYKFSAFLTKEYAFKFGLFDQTLQYEKSFNFLNKLESYLPNKYAFKKLIQSIITSTNSQLTPNDTISNKIDEIKSKIKSITKNNPTINLELDNLFDKRLLNIEPVYESINLTDDIGHCDAHEEFIDLTLNDEQINNTTTNNSKMLKNSKQKLICKKDKKSKKQSD